jgi:hypothetical protein
MITGSEKEELLFVLVPISAKAAEHGGSVVHSVRQHAEFHIGIGDDAAVITNKIWHCHGFTFLSPTTGLKNSVYHTDGIRSRLALDLKSQQADQSDERGGEVKRHTMTNTLEKTGGKQRSNNS